MIDWNMRRRDLLRQLGQGAALIPLLHATRSFAAAPVFPRRLIIVVATNGYPEGGAFTPSGTGDALSGLTFSDTLSPLDPWKKQLVVFPELSCPNAAGSEDFHRVYSIMLTSAPAIHSRGDNGVASPTAATIDQVIAADISTRVNLPRPTLTLSQEFAPGSAVEAKIEAQRAFWRGQNQPVTPEFSPSTLAASLFSGTSQANPALQKMRAEKKGILDFVGRDLERFGQRLGTEDRLAIQGHLQGIRDIERQLTATAVASAGGGGGVQCGAPTQPAGSALSGYPASLSQNMDLMVAALRCDVTRVATLQLGNAWENGRTFPWLGINNTLKDPSWHGLGHADRADGAGSHTDKVKVDKWFMSQFAALLQRLADTPEAGPNSTSMLDNTVVLWTNTMWEGNHKPKLPWLLAGSCGGYFKTGQYLRSAKGAPCGRILTDVCNAMLDIPRPYFGVESLGGGPLPGLKA